MTPHSLDKAKNAIRGALASSKQDDAQWDAKLRTAIGKELAALSDGDTAPFLAWLKRYPSSQAPLFIPSRRETYADIPLHHAISISRVSSQIQVALFQILPHIEILKSYVGSLDLLERSWAAGDASGIEYCLSQIEEKCGLSLTLVEARIAFLQEFRGLEAQKRYTRSIHEAAPYKMAAFAAHYLSERYENDSSIAGFGQRMDSVLDGMMKTNDLLATFGKIFFLRKDLIDVSEEALAKYLSVTSSLSVVDAYEGFLAAAQAMFRLGDQSDEWDLLLAACDALTVDDYRLTKLKACLRGEFSEVPAVSPAAEEAFLQGDISHALTLANKRAIASPLDVDALSVIASCLAYSSSSYDYDRYPAFQRRILQLLVDLKRRSSGYKEACVGAEKLITNYSFLRIVRALHGYIGIETESQPPLPIACLANTLLNSPAIGPYQVVGLAHGNYDSAVAHCCSQEAAPLVSSLVCALAGSDVVPQSISPDSLRHELECRIAIAKDDLDTALQLATLLNSGTSAIRRRRGLAMQIYCLIQLDKSDEAISCLAQSCVVDPDTQHSLPVLNPLLSEPWPVLKHMANSPYLAIALSLAVGLSETTALLRNRRFAYDDFIRSCGVDRPSRLESQLDELAERFTRPLIINFLQFVCIPQIMDVSFQTFKHSKELFEERVEICKLLIKFDADHADVHTAELSDLTRHLAVADGLTSIDHTRVYINLPSIVRSVLPSVVEPLDRCKALLAAGVPELSSEGVSTAFNQLIAGDSKQLAELLKYPVDEVDSIVASMYRQVAAVFFSSPDHGLDGYLSTRIRHGSLEGFLRGPLEERGLILSKDAKSKVTTAELPEWTAQLPLSEQDGVSKALKDFTVEYDQIIDDLLRQRLQIQDDSKRDGLFSLPEHRGVYLYLRSKIQRDTSVESFVEELLLLLEGVLARNLTDVRRFLEEQTKSAVELSIEHLRAALHGSLSPYRALFVDQQISQCILEIQQAFQRIVGWFERGAHESRYLRTLEDIVAVGVEAVKLAYKSFAPDISLDVTQTEPQTGDALPVFTDIIFTVFDNIRRHSGIAQSSKVKLVAHASPLDETFQRLVSLRIENDVAAGVRNAETEKNLDKLRDLIKTGAYRRHVNSEGGTGLLKLQRLISDYPDHKLSFGFSSDTSFYVETTLRLVFLSGEQVKRTGIA